MKQFKSSYRFIKTQLGRLLYEEKHVRVHTAQAKGIFPQISLRFITALQRSCGKVMFSQVCVCLQRGGYAWSQVPSEGWWVISRGWVYLAGTHLPPDTGPSKGVLTSSGGNRSGWYVSYWNEFIIYTEQRRKRQQIFL